ncbi:related to Importin subunit beta-2 [Saccharomycodes ludwigii]|uniref:Related to Importin subunit beta-2 n=1 Tax=Saccharomycodes ludwigii TaxID=36035 RepID=A0A376BBH4_9ASCO|nr:related to Importin subunit beta-2 [Saccharomycodes ludwigii]
MVSTWSPDLNNVQQLCEILQNSMSPNHELRTQSMQLLDSFKEQPEFLNYLCYILLLEGKDPTISATAGLLLKNCLLLPLDNNNNNNVMNNHGLVLDDYIKLNIIKGLSPAYPKLVTNITGIVITTLFSTYFARSHRDDPLGLQLLLNLLTLVKTEKNEASIKALSKIMEDAAQFFQLPWTVEEVKPIEVLIQAFLEFISLDAYSDSFIIRSETIKCLNCIIPLNSQFFIVQLDFFLQSIFTLATNDSNDKVREQICITFTTLLDFRPDKLIDNLQGIIQFVLHLINNSSIEGNKSRVGLEACEFLLSLSNNSHIPEILIKPYLPSIIPALITHMCFDEEEILIVDSLNDEDDSGVPDKDEDIKPLISSATKSKARPNEEEEDDDDNDVGTDGDEIDTSWSLRKCSAATLDSLTNLLPQDVIKISYPLLRQHLASEKWYVREATILALGAMAEGGIKYASDQLSIIIPFLVEELKDHWYPVRKMSCWTLSRFSPWIYSDNTEFLLPVLEPILNNVLFDKRKCVQQAAISCVAYFIDNADYEIVSTLLYNELLSTFTKCFTTYQKRNMFVLYDAIGSLAEKVEFDERAMSTVIPPLLNKWNVVTDTDKELWPLLECLSYVIISLGEFFLPLAPQVFSRVWFILCNCVELEARSQQDPTVVVPEKDFEITSLDLIDGLIQGLNSSIENTLIFAQASPNIFDVLLEVLKDPTHEVRQSAFALLGDVAYYYTDKLQPYQDQPYKDYLPKFLAVIGNEIMHNDELDSVGAVNSLNNAIWALGLISERIDLQEYIIDLSRVVLDLFLGGGDGVNNNTAIAVHISIVENLAVCIGRMGIHHPEIFSTNDSPFCSINAIEKWCDSCIDIPDPEEKTVCYHGFIRIMNLIDRTKIRMNCIILKKMLKGLMENVDLKAINQDLYGFLINNSELVSQLNTNSPEYQFVAQIM